ncbi:MAG TPA: hypothetical protein VGD98_19140 [Ktedonobacteraceae bacterium]
MPEQSIRLFSLACTEKRGCYSWKYSQQAADQALYERAPDCFTAALEVLPRQNEDYSRREQ